MTKIEDYFYHEQFMDIDPAYADDFIRTKFKQTLGGCSSVRKGNLYGRNYDWKYNNTNYFLVDVFRSSNSKYYYHGMAGIDNLQEEDYKVLPFILLDGINENGVVANVNVVPINDKGRTTGTTPAIEQRDEVCQVGLVSYILQNFKTATEAVTYIRDYVSVYAPLKIDMELHIMVADENYTYILEFIENELKILSGREFMTNFHIFGTNLNTDGHVDISSVSDYGSGVERFNIISDNYAGLKDRKSMQNLLKKLYFSNAYKETTDPIWKTEFVDPSNELKVTTDISEFMPTIEAARELYKNATRDGRLWQTCHTTIYDIDTKTIFISVQESGRYNIAPMRRIKTMVLKDYNPLTNSATFSYHNTADISDLPTLTEPGKNDLRYQGPVAQGSTAICDCKIEVYSLTAENTWVKIVG